jgi:pimeloyl-ACP methyl ester carboxylesterase
MNTRAAGTHVDATVDGRRVRVRVLGSVGSPGVVLLHGGAAHGGWWEHVLTPLAERYRVAVPDLAGYGHSDPAPSYSYDVWARDALAAAEAAGITGRPVLIGHSQGGVVALRAAERFGERLAGVVAVDSAFGRWPEAALEPYLRKARRGHRRYTDRADALARFGLQPERLGVAEEDRLRLAAESLRETSDGGWTWRYDPRTIQQAPIDVEELGRARCPAALVVGERGVTTPEMNAAVVRALGGEVPVHVLPGVGHHVPVAAPGALLDVVTPLVARWSR